MRYVIVLQILLHQKCYSHFQKVKDFVKQKVHCKLYILSPNFGINRCDRYYDAGFMKTARTTGFGFGQKYDFSKTARCSPPCNSYNLKSDFDPTHSERKGFGFGKGREEMVVTGPLVEAIKNKNPGPGTYEVPSTLENSNFTFTSKREEIVNKSKSKTPGPGYYPVTLAINKQGKYPVSKLKNILCRNFGTTLGRKDITYSRGPSPGAYDITKASISPDGKYPLSKM
jgi:hypothetical protein